MKTLNHIPIGTEVICSLDNETFIAELLSEPELITFCEFGYFDGVYQYAVKKNNGDICYCNCESVSPIKKVNVKLQNFSKLKNLFNINLCSI